MMSGFWRVKSYQSHNWCICWCFICPNACDLPITHHQNISEWCHSWKTCPIMAIITEQLQQFWDRPHISLNCNWKICLSAYSSVNLPNCCDLWQPACFGMSLGIHSNSMELADTAQDLWGGAPCPPGTASRDWTRSPRAPHNTYF